MRLQQYKQDKYGLKKNSRNENKFAPDSERVFVALGIQHAMRMRYIVICGLPGSTIFFKIISRTAQF